MGIIIKSALFVICLSLSLNVIAQNKTFEDISVDAMTIVEDMGVGWNLGNTMEAYNIGSQDTETSWGNPRTTKEMIDSVAAAGFKSIRLPICWYPHFKYDGTTLKIDESWMNRVKEIVGYCLNNNLYVVINTHHETWLEGHPTYADSANVYKQFRLLWIEIANAFKDYDKHVLFAGMNEVHLYNNWGRPTDENTNVQNDYNQVFVNAVRATEGNNSLRNLVVQTYVANARFGVELFKMPTDKVKNRLIVEMHNYDPYKYGLTDDIRFWGTPYKIYGTDSENDESELEAIYKRLKETFTDKGIPFIIGEMGSNYHTYKDADEQKIVEESCGYYYSKVFETIRRNGGVPFIWDNGMTMRRGKECFGLFDRRNHMKCMHPLVIYALSKIK